MVKYRTISPNSRKKTSLSTLTTSIQQYTRNPTDYNTEKRNKKHQDQKKEVNLSVYKTYCFMYKSPKASLK